MQFYTNRADLFATIILSICNAIAVEAENITGMPFDNSSQQYLTRMSAVIGNVCKVKQPLPIELPKRGADAMLYVAESFNKSSKDSLVIIDSRTIRSIHRNAATTDVYRTLVSILVRLKVVSDLFPVPVCDIITHLSPTIYDNAIEDITVDDGYVPPEYFKFKIDYTKLVPRKVTKSESRSINIPHAELANEVTSRFGGKSSGSTVVPHYNSAYHEYDYEDAYVPEVCMPGKVARSTKVSLR
jgi:hypothetical protein